ncbi:Core-2/I-Branching enzyme [Musa troglodytarum]|uniref:Core-2/I-Branching enzyme n=1 Tax=Musa troglodytarum TaxID=320322 RepID=A0A9E7KP46_9LILI|nr:Core-2/I-Branching enzyme [Musa troglodytarum]
MEMMKAKIPLLHRAMDKRWVWPVMLISIVLVFFAAASNMTILSSIHTMSYLTNATTPAIVESTSFPAPPPPPVGSPIPRLAYFISGSKGDLDRLWRTLRALYHPRNLYVVHLDLESPASERLRLISCVANETLFAKVGNVHVIKKSNMVTYRGPTMIANTLHASAVLLKKGEQWDWFINLSASDYPLVTQDDILHTFSSLPRNISFVEHTSRLDWKEGQRARPLIVDPALYMTKKTDLLWVTQRREIPTAFKLFTGSAWVALPREFVEFCVWGWDNLPRRLLMYYTNFVSSPEGYFQTVICNVPEFSNTVANHDLHYIAWDVPPKQHPRVLTMADMPKMVGSNAPFARKFGRDDPVLDKIDAELLGRANGSFVPGGWCAGSPPCSDVGDPTLLRPGPGARRVTLLMDGIVRSNNFGRNQCK